MTDVLRFDATQGVLDDLGRGWGSQAVVLAGRDAATGGPMTGQTYFIDPSNWRFHDLNRVMPNGLTDRRASIQVLLDFAGAPELAEEGGAAYQPEFHSVANRSTRFTEPGGNSALPTSLFRVIDSEDQRFALSLVSKSRPFIGPRGFPGFDPPTPRDLDGTTLGKADPKEDGGTPATNSDGSQGTQERKRPTTREKTPRDLRPEGYVWSTQGKAGLLGSFFEPCLSGFVYDTGVLGTPIGPLVARTDAQFGKPNPGIQDGQRAIIKPETRPTFVGPIHFESDFILAKMPNASGGYEQRRVPTQEFKKFDGVPVRGDLYFDSTLGSEIGGPADNSPPGAWVVGLQLPTPEQFKTLYKNVMIPGPPGPKGPKGDRGPQGPPGKDGKDGKGASGGEEETFVGTIDDVQMLTEQRAKQDRAGGSGVACPNVPFHNPYPGDPGALHVPQGDELNQQYGWANVQQADGQLTFGGAEGGIPIVPGGTGTTVANWIPGQIGQPGGSTTMEGQVALLTATLAAVQEVVLGLAGGPNYFAGNLVAIHRNSPGINPPAGSTIGQWTTAYDGRALNIGDLGSPFEVLSILETQGSGAIDTEDLRDAATRVADAASGLAYSMGVFTVAREIRGQNITDARALVYLDNDRTQTGQVTGKLIDTTDDAFSVTREGDVGCGDVDAEDVECETLDCSGPAEFGDEITVTENIYCKGLLRAESGLYANDPSAARPGRVTNQGYGLWFKNDGTVQYYDGTTDIDLTAGSGGSAGPGYYGDGSDGDLDIPNDVGSNITLTGVNYWDNLILGSYNVSTAGYIAWIATACDASGGGVFKNNGSNGGNATSGSLSGAGGTGAPGAYYAGGQNGGNGGHGGGLNGTSAASSFGGGGGGGGASNGEYSAGTGGSVIGPSASLGEPRNYTNLTTGLLQYGGGVTAFSPGAGAGGGAGSTASGQGSGGGGGGGGGCCVVVAKSIDTGSTPGVIQAAGGNGGNGATDGAGGVAGGGGGGGGGIAGLVAGSKTGTGTLTASGGSGGGPAGGGSAGSNGNAGNTYEVTA